MGDKNVHEVLKVLSAPIPSPAAASAAALAAGAGASLLIMAAEITARRLPEGPERIEIEAIRDKASRMRNMLEDIYDQDPKAYARVVEIRKQPRSPERDEMLERAWKTATLIPGAMGRAAMITLRLTADLAPKSPDIASPDIITAAWLSHAAVQASLNIVQRNLPQIADEAFQEKIRRNLSFLDERDALLQSVLEVTNSRETTDERR